MGKRLGTKRRRNERDNEDEHKTEDVVEVVEREMVVSDDVQEEQQAVDDGDAEGEATGDAPATPVQDSKRKRAPMNTPSTAQEEAELARRRRRRQSLVFQKRRQSLTPSTSKAQGSGSGGEGEPSSRQYISDMYSTIIKMSSENKINIKNTWSLHLIDHMEDILSSPQKERAGAVADDANTFNFQKASCTLDASVKIYSYRVDDTWTSSYKILENLSRSGGEKRADGDDENGEGEDGEEGGEDGEGNTQRRGKKKGSRKAGSAAKTIEKNLNNITLKSYELDFEPDPLFHKMSQTFDEGGAKGMLLANLSVYDGAKILLNSADVKLATRKSMLKKAQESKTDGNMEEENAPKPSSKISLSALGKLACLTRDIMPLEVCPPLKRLYDQVEEMRDPDMTQSKVILPGCALTFAPRTRSHLDASFVESTFGLDDDVAASVEADEEDAAMEEASELPPLREEDEELTATNDNDDNNGEDDDDNIEPADQSFDFGAGEEMDVQMEDGDISIIASADEPEDQVVDEESAANKSMLDVEEEVDVNEAVTERHVDPVTDTADGPKSMVIKSAADYFRSQMQDDSVKNEEDVAYSQLIETALMRSVALEADGAAEDDQNEYSYFDAKLLKNWAGPSHWKSRGSRRIPARLLAFVEEVDGDVQPAAKAKRGRKAQPKKANTVSAEKRSMIIDFTGEAPLDMAKLLKAPRLAADVAMSKLVIRKQLQKSADLVFPVDAHIEPKIFFRHFMKPRLQLFHRRVQQSRGGDMAEEPFLPCASDPALAETDNLAFEDNDNYNAHDFGGGGYSDDDDSDNDHDREGSSAFFDSANLITAERVVEKIDVHYERVAKRVDVKKLKTSIWSHLEAETGVTGKRSSRQRSADDSAQPEPESSDEDIADTPVESTTSFDSVVQGVAGKVPSNVTVSFYFICMLHLANEKGLRLTGQDDLSNFEIKKEEPLGRN